MDVPPLREPGLPTPRKQFLKKGMTVFFGRPFSGQSCRRWITLSLILLSFCARQAVAGEVPITILHTNDLHQHLEPLPRIAGYVAEYKRDHPNTVFVDAGDYFDRGSSLVPMTLGEAMYGAMSRMGYDMCIMGNHDWAYGGQRMFELIEKHPMPMLGTNLATTKPSMPANWFRTIVKEFNGIRVGFLGITLDTYGKNPRRRPNIYVLDVRKETAKAVGELKRAKVDLIVAVTHLGFKKMKHEIQTGVRCPSDVDLVKANPDIDVVVGGHSHSLLPEKVTRQLYKETGAIIVQGGASGRWVGRLTLVVDDETRRIERFDLEHVPTNEKLPEHPGVAAFLKQQYRQHMPNAKTVIGRFEQSIEFHNLAYWHADFVREQTGADIVMLPRRTLYDEPKSFAKGDVTVERLFGYIYDRYLIESIVSGAELLRYCNEDAMRHRFHPFHDRGRPFSGDAMFYSGMNVTFNSANGSVEFDLEPDRQYTLVTPWPFGRGSHRLAPRRDAEGAKPIPGLNTREAVVMPRTTRELLVAAGLGNRLKFYRKYPEPRPDWAPWDKAWRKLTTSHK